MNGEPDDLQVGYDAPDVGRQPAHRKGSRKMTEVRMSRMSMWGFLVIAFLLGAGIGLGGLLWQRSSLLADMRALERRLDSSESSAAASALQLERVQTRLASSETSVADLVAANSQLVSDLASATLALENAKAGAVTVTERTVSPTSVEASRSLALTVKVRGRAEKVQMKITGPNKYSKVYNLTRGSSSGGVDTWKRTVTSPGKKGVYSYSATAFAGGKTYEMPGTSGWTFEVK